MHSTQSLQLFTQSINGLIDSKLIMVNQNIESVLKSVASVSVFTNCLVETLKTTNYVNELNRATVTFMGADRRQKKQLKLPIDKNRAFTLVVCLLTEIDCGKRNFLDFLKEYFNANEPTESYDMFVEQILLPFKTIGQYMLKDADPQSFDKQATDRAYDYFQATPVYINSEMLHLVLGAIQSVREFTQEDEILSTEDVNQRLLMCDALTNAMQLKNPKMIKIMWVGFVNTFKLEPQIHQYLNVIRQILRGQNLI